MSDKKFKCEICLKRFAEKDTIAYDSGYPKGFVHFCTNDWNTMMNNIKKERPDLLK